MKERILSEHFGKVKNTLIEYSKHFDIANHGSMKGFGREALINEFLKTHLPDQIEYLTGEILDEFDTRSGQVDIILQSKYFPKIPLLSDIQLVFADAVMAAIEVKSDLNTQHLEKSLDQFVKIKSLKRQTKIEGGVNALSLEKIPCIIFAFKGLSRKTLIANIKKYAKDRKISIDLCAPDIVVVLNSNFYLCNNDGWIFPIDPKIERYCRSWEGTAHENLVGLYQYLFNVSISYFHKMPNMEIGPYFDKSILKR